MPAYNERQKGKLCANFKPSNGAHPFITKGLGVNCKDCLYFSAKNCGAHAGLMGLGA